jgi:hypothetical protein
MFETDQDAVVAANEGPMGAVLWEPGAGAGHMVVTEPMGNSEYLVRDPTGPFGKTYYVTEEWIRNTVAGGTYRIQ